ncbi:uncharacterized protein [Hyperolius riggenbachi]|uniref:uncharacterized protein n=1 Tax=Hyperolius riggenbachi TaxID=752182 RepID=UPI0035A28602
MDHKQLQANILNFSLNDGALGSQGYKKVLLQLFGLTGHGKSSFINSCQYVLDDKNQFEVIAEAGEKLDGSSMTQVRKAYELTELITLVDNRGCSNMNDFQKAEVFAQLGNFLPMDEEVHWEDNYSPMMEKVEEAKMEPNFTDFLVPIFVYSAENILAEKLVEDFKHFMNNCSDMTGVFPIIVLTNKTSGDYFALEKQFKLMGAEIVTAIENYTVGRELKTLGKTTDILTVIDSALKNVRFRLEQPRNPEKEQRERKKFLLNYIHKAGQEKSEQERLKKEEEKKNEEKLGIWAWLRRFFGYKW